MSFLDAEEKRALRTSQKLLYSSGQFPLRGGAAASRRARRRVSPAKALAVGVAVGIALVIALVALLTRSG